MNKDIKAKWVAKLRDPATKQCRSELFEPDGACCALGALCEVMVEAGRAVKFTCLTTGTVLIRHASQTEHAARSTSLPSLLQEEVGLDFCECSQIVSMNDHCRRSFTEIADYVEMAL